MNIALKKILALVFVMLIFTLKGQAQIADKIIINGKITTFDEQSGDVQAIAILGNKILKTGSNSDILKLANKKTQVIDANNRRVIPGLNDDHIHVIRGGRFFNLELRWDGVPTLKQAMEMLKEQAARTPEGQWVRIIGGWNEYQFQEKRLPTLEEINEAVPDKPVFILYLYGKGWLNKKGLELMNYTASTPNPMGGLIEKDEDGNPTGLLVSEPNATVLYQTIGKLPGTDQEGAINSTQQIMREFNRFGLTSGNDASGGANFYPEDYKYVQDLARNQKLTLRLPYFLFAQSYGKELEDYYKWVNMLDHNHQDESLVKGNLVHQGAGENLTWYAGDFEDFLFPRPDLPPIMDPTLKSILEVIVSHKWPFRLHATYNESISRFLNVIEDVNRTMPFNGLRWFFDHCETISDDNLKRVKALGGGIALQDRMAFQGEAFTKRYGKAAAENSPPIKKIIELEIPVALGTDATRVSTYNPWISLYWAVSGKTVGGKKIYPDNKVLSRDKALNLYTVGSAWFSNEENIKGRIKVGQLADIAILSADYFSVSEEDIKTIESVLTIMDGKIVYGKEEFKDIAPKPIAAIPAWSPVNFYNGYGGKSK